MVRGGRIALAAGRPAGFVLCSAHPGAQGRHARGRQLARRDRGRARHASGGASEARSCTGPRIGWPPRGSIHRPRLARVKPTLPMGRITLAAFWLEADCVPIRPAFWLTRPQFRSFCQTATSSATMHTNGMWPAASATMCRRRCARCPRRRGPAQPGQEEQLLAFLATEFAGRWHWMAERFLAEGGRISDYMLLWTEEGVQGACRLTFEDSRWPIDRFYPFGLPRPWGQLGSIGVSAHLRGQGLGLKLLDAGLRRLHNSGIKWLRHRLDHASRLLCHLRLQAISKVGTVASNA